MNDRSRTCYSIDIGIFGKGFYSIAFHNEKRYRRNEKKQRELVGKNRDLEFSILFHAIFV